MDNRVIRSLLDTSTRISSGMVLPSQRFFTPTQRFWQVLRHEVPTNVTLVDCGCGMGDLIPEGKENGFVIQGIDICRREGQNPEVSIRSAHMFQWQENVWPLICRPDHSGWVSVVAENARLMGAKLLYVSKYNNYERDVGRIRGVSRGLVGEEGERLYVLNPYTRR
jgi:hypothetical protein